MKILRKDYIRIEGGRIPITLSIEEDVESEYMPIIEDGRVYADLNTKEKYIIEIDGVEWVTTKSQMHAVVLYEMLRDNVTDYVEYRIKG